MKLTSGIQEALVSLLLYSEAGKTVRGLVPPEHFDPYYREIVEAAHEYIDRYGKVPDDHALDIIDKLKADFPKRADIYDRIVASIWDQKGSLNLEYVLHETNAFMRAQTIRRGIAQAIDAAERDTADGVEEAERIMRACLDKSYTLFDPGLVVGEDPRTLAWLDPERVTAFPTGIRELDQLGLGPARKRLLLLLGLYGYGKSWWMVHLVKKAYQCRLRVVYVTLELSDEEMTQRIIQALFAVSKHKKDRWLKFDGKGKKFKGFREIEGNRSYFEHEDWLREKVSELKRRIVVKEFPTGELTIPQLNGYLDTLESSEGFIPDLLIVDYPDLMYLPGRDTTREIGNVFRQLRGIAVRRNLAVVTVSQINRAGSKVPVQRGEHVAADWSKLATADVVLIHSQTDFEKEMGVARLRVDKGRTDRDKFTLLITQSYATGQFVIDSMGYHQDYQEALKDLGDGD